jgi:hypothetical protein
MDWYWTIDRWQIAVAIQAGRVLRRADGHDWIDKCGGAWSKTFGTVRLGRKFDPFHAAGLVVLGVGDRWTWTSAGLDAFAAESARRNRAVVVR